MASTGSQSGFGATRPACGTLTAVNVYHFGPADGPTVLALHGVTGHGKRWARLAADQLADLHVVAPDLRGHGRSSYLPPWTLEQLAADAIALLDAPVVVVGHSFGAFVALHLARARPDLVRGLLLLDPSIGIEPQRLLEYATATVESPDYTDVAEARNEKLGDAWAEVAADVREAELAEHLVPTRDGRVGWRLCVPAIASYWSQMAREFVLPPADIPTIAVIAGNARPAYSSAEFRNALAALPNVTMVEFDCDHMVPQARPAETAELVRKLLGADL